MWSGPTKPACCVTRRLPESTTKLGMPRTSRSARQVEDIFPYRLLTRPPCPPCPQLYVRLQEQQRDTVRTTPPRNPRAREQEHFERFRRITSHRRQEVRQWAARLTYIFRNGQC